MSAQAFTPSRVARSLAGQLWPDVQDQRKVGPGVFEFSCAGHGGLVAVLDAARFDARAVEVAERFDKCELVVAERGRLYTTERYTRESLERVAEVRGEGRWLCWVGEEDCDWALLVVADPSLATGMVRVGRSDWSAERLVTYARENAGRWNQDFLDVFDAGRRPEYGGSDPLSAYRVEMDLLALESPS